MNTDNEKRLIPEFDVWFSTKWIASGGLITPATAAKILKKTTARIAQMMTEGKLETYRYGNATFVSFPAVMRMAHEKQYQEAYKEIKKIKKLPISEEQKKVFYDDMMLLAETLKNQVTEK